MDWCYRLCLKLCCCREPKTSEDNLLRSQKPVGSYTVRRISSFGQTVLNEKGEECEIGRHCSILKSMNGHPVPLPWMTTPTTVQPGITDAEFDERVRKMPTISESEPGPKLRGRKCGRNREEKRQRSPWSRALANVKKANNFQSNRIVKSQLYLNTYGPSCETVGSTLDGSEYRGDEDVYGESRIKKMKKRGVGNVRRASYLTVDHPPPITESSPDLHRSEDPVLIPETFCKVETVSSMELREAARSILLEDIHLSGDSATPLWARSRSLLNVSDAERRNIGKEEYGSKENDDRLGNICNTDLPRKINKEENQLVTNATALQRALHCLDSVRDVWSYQHHGIIVFTTQLLPSNQISVGVKHLNNLSGEGLAGEAYPVVVKLCLLPGKKSQKVGQIPLQPSHLEHHFTLSIKEPATVLRLSVFNGDWMGSHDAVGHAMLCLEDTSEDITTHEMKLYTQSTPDPSAGLLQMSIGCSSDYFNITVIKAFKLLPDLYRSKLYLKIAYYSMSKKVKEKTSEPCWSEGDEVVFNHSVKLKAIQGLGYNHECVAVSLKQRDRGVFRKDPTRGRVLLGPWPYAGDGSLTPWGRVIISGEQLLSSFIMYL